MPEWDSIFLNKGNALLVKFWYIDIGLDRLRFISVNIYGLS